MSTYTPIASQTLTSDVTTVTFSNLPQGYTDLIIIAQMKNNGVGSDLLARFNSDSGGNYSRTILGGNGSSTYSARVANATFARFNYSEPITTDGNTIFRINLMNYSNSTTNKTIINRGDRGATSTVAIVNIWRSTSAITNIEFFTDAGGYLATGSKINIYGIASASLQAPASGGNIVTTDGTYWYHTFTSSGTFTPSTNLTNADFLVVGGGGGSFNYGSGAGGGGAGGLRTSYGSTSGGGSSAEAKRNFTSGTSYTITVGAGGAVQNHNSGNTAASAANGNNSSIAGSGFTTITSNGGGGGADYTNNGGTAGNGATGGSGGGAASSGPYTYTGGSGTVNQGYSGGNSIPDANVGGNAGGGGGAGGAGQNPTSATGTNDGGAGGAGLAVSITGTSVTYATGGKGGRNNVAVVNGPANTGNGGARGSSGGSGVVIIRYAV